MKENNTVNRAVLPAWKTEAVDHDSMLSTDTTKRDRSSFVDPCRFRQRSSSIMSVLSNFPFDELVRSEVAYHVGSPVIDIIIAYRVGRGV